MIGSTKRRSSTSEEEIPDESVNKAESPKSSIFEQLQVAENEAIQENSNDDKYTTKSMPDLQRLLHKKLGTSSKTSETLQVIIQIARDRFAYFANLLHY